MIAFAENIIKESVDNIKHHYDNLFASAWFKALESTDFKQGIASLLAANDYTAYSLLTLFMPKGNDEEIKEWRNAIYKYTLSLSYPENAILPDLPDLKDNALVFLEIYRIMGQHEREFGNTLFIKDYPFELLSEKEYQDLEDKREYDLIRAAFRFDYIYELMKLSRELFPYTSLEHITGVHYLALFIARQLKAKGVKIDLGKVSGAAAVHDLGKFGCRPEESHKVAYYHYYYTEEWCYRKGIEYIRNIAVNHSTWDLELESLSIESLVLIYADFRVKEPVDKNYHLPMKFYDLAESFEVILAKLDNVDSAKELRYKKVYNKLADFQDYLLSLGVKNSFIKEQQLQAQQLRDYDFASNLSRLKLLSFEHSFAAMYSLRSEQSLEELLDQINNCTETVKISRYFSLLKQFSRYLTPKQKLLLLDFLFRRLLDDEENLRYQAVDLMAELIASFDAPYSKYLPPRISEHIYKISKSKVLSDYCQRFLKTRAISQEKQKRLTKSLANLFRAVIKKSAEATEIIDILLQLLSETKITEKSILLESLYNLDVSLFSKEQREYLANILKLSLKQKQSNLIAVYIVLENAYTEYETFNSLADELIAKKYRLVNSQLRNLLFLKKTGKVQPLSSVQQEQLALENLKIASPLWQKMLNVEYIAYLCQYEQEKQYYWSTHLANMVKHSGNYELRHKAAQVLTVLFEHLNTAEKNDIVYDLLTGLEIEDYNYSKDIAPLIALLISKLGLAESLEIISDLAAIMESSLEAKKCLILESVGYTLKEWLKKPDFDIDSPEVELAVGILFSALISHNQAVHEAAFNALTARLFNFDFDLNHQYQLLQKFIQKFILIMERTPQHFKNQTLTYAAGYNKVYAFLIEYRYEVGKYMAPKVRKVAYFSGSFDPFSLGQKAIAEKLSERGYDVYINVDNLKWQRRTQPLLLRQRLIELSIASLNNVYLMHSLPVINLELPDGREQLENLFKGREVHLVLGEEALPKAETVNSLAHNDFKKIVIGRQKRLSQTLKSKLSEMQSAEYLNTDFEFSQITAEMIRNAINAGHDISDMVDRAAIAEIKKYNMYKNEPTFKTAADVLETASILKAPLDEELLVAVKQQFDIELEQYVKTKEQVVFINRNKKTAKINALGVYSPLERSEYQKIKALDSVKTSYSEMYLENTIKIDLLIGRRADLLHNHLLMLHTEMLVYAHNHGYEFALFDAKGIKNLEKLMQSTAYKSLPDCNYALTCFKKPVVIILDAQSAFKHNYRKDGHIRKALSQARETLLQFLAKEKQGIAILAFDRGMLYDKINRIVEKLNPLSDGNKWGDNICVPFGDIYSRWLLPNSVTKALHTERLYDSTYSYYEIVTQAAYHPIETQIEVIKAFKKPVLLIDDIVHHGLRLEALESHLRKADVELNGVVAGIATRTGKMRVVKKDYKLNAGYFLNEIDSWHIESALYPFIGGDAINMSFKRDLIIASINHILPYKLMRNKTSDFKTMAKFSLTCLEQALAILEATESAYLERNHEALKIDYLGEVFVTPRVPENYQQMLFDYTTLPSDVIRKDLLKLKRFLQVL